MKGFMLVTVARGLALFLGAFSLLNLVGEIRWRGFDASLWWIDLRPLPVELARFLLGGGALILLAFALRPNAGRMRRLATAGLAGIFGVVCILDAARFWMLLGRGEIKSSFAVPVSLVMAAALGVVALSPLRCAGPRPARRSWIGVALVAIGAAVGFPLAQMACFGHTDYRRPADVAVVFGARVYADGRPSSALADRVSMGVELYRAGLVRTLIFSGGPGEGAIDETQAMRIQALAMGVAEGDILLDPQGVNTAATVRNTCEILRERGWRRVMAVSHAYHLPRVKMTYARAGVEVFTVPVKEPLRGTPRFAAREVLALWAYYLAPLWQRG